LIDLLTDFMENGISEQSHLLTALSPGSLMARFLGNIGDELIKK